MWVVSWAQNTAYLRDHEESEALVAILLAAGFSVTSSFVHYYDLHTVPEDCV